MATISSNDPLARVATAARVVRRFSTWGASAGLAVGTVTFVALAPWLPGLDAWSIPAGVLLAAALVAAPLRVMWHGGRIAAAYGDPAHVEALLVDVPGALEEVVQGLRAAVVPEGRGLRRVLAAWRALTGVRGVLQDSPARQRVDALVDPLRPEALGLTTAALWVTLGVLVLGVPVALVSLVGLLLT